MSDTDTEVVARLEAALAFDVDPDDSSPLSTTRRAEIEATLSVLRGDPEADEEADALRSILGGGEKFLGEAATPAEEEAHVMPGEQDLVGVAEDTAPHADDSTDAKLAAIQAQLAALAGGVQQATTPAPVVTLADVLANLDPRDSDAALALFGWLWDNQRFGVIGTLNGGGYMLHYQEPKGSTQAGYMAGGTQGARMVDAAVEKAKAAGAKAVKRGICEKCFSGVREQEDGSVVLDDDENLSAACSGGGSHILHA